MDLIYSDQNKIEQGILQNFDVDFDTTSQKNFQISVGIKNNVLQGGFWWYIEGTEYGGRVDAYNIITEDDEIQYKGRNFRGILDTKVIEPPTGQDYKILLGTIKEVIGTLIADAGLEELFVVDDCDIQVNYQFNRYITTYEGICMMLKKYGLVPSFIVRDGIVHISASAPTDYSNENEYSQDDLKFSIKKSFADVNHLICLGQGELANRTVIHLYTDANGNISEIKTLFGEDEVVDVYENTNAEDAATLKAEGIDRLNELKNTDSFEVTIPDYEYKIGDIIGGIETVTNTYVAREIVNIIAKISDTKIDIEYKVGEDDTKKQSSSSGESGGSSSSGGGGGQYTLPPATKTSLGGVIVGDGIEVDASGKISVVVDSAFDGYSPEDFAESEHTHSNATTSKAGFMSSSDKSKLNGIATGANKTTVDGSFSPTSSNPIQNKVVTEYINGHNTVHATLLSWESRQISFSAIGTNISVPELATANELLIIVQAGTTQYQYEFTILPKVMTSGRLITGYDTGTYHGICDLGYVISANVIAINNLMVGNTSYTSGTITICYR